MIVPSIDLQGGRTVQLVGGRDLALEAGDPAPLAARFGRVGEIAVIDLDAALGTGDNAALIAPLLDMARCRVGGGIRSVEQARRWLDAGAERIIIGTAATPALLRQLPPERVIVALDARDGEVVVEGWTRGTGRGVTERMAELRGLCGGFLVTFVEREGRMVGLDAGLVRDLVAKPQARRA
jgi:phosphoribosyl-ATP pyrophosphohydrolase/phosphoribosyl-AMP cyclohydrolase